MTDQIKYLQEKIAQVQKDLDSSLSEDNSERKRTTLSDYLDYLKDELRNAQQNQSK